MFKRIAVKSDPLSLYEIKTADLRVYLFRDPNGAIVVLGGKKSTQVRDIKRFRNVAKEYYNYDQQRRAHQKS